MTNSLASHRVVLASGLQKPVRQPKNQLPLSDDILPRRGDGVYAVIGAGKLTVDGRCGVGVISQVHRQEAPFLKSL